MKKTSIIEVLKLLAGYIVLAMIHYLITANFEKDIAVMQNLSASFAKLILVGILLGLLIKTVDVTYGKSQEKIVVLCVTILFAILPVVLHSMCMVNIPSACVDAAKDFMLLTGVFIGEIILAKR